MKKQRVYQVLVLVALIIAGFCILIIKKEIKITPIFADGYELTGIDVSHYQGTIDWEKLAEQDLDFAFIKATEGSSHVDECFDDNWQEAGKTDLYIGAYHFFSFDSDGDKQAELYIDTVDDLDGKIAPAVDVEFYGDKESNPPRKDEVVSQLGKMLKTLEEYYQVKPVIYTTYKAYYDYIKGEFDEYPLWIRNVYYQPLFTAGNRWTFWQYTDTAVLEGYQGTEKYIDMNVFRGTREELEKLIVRGEGTESSLEEVGFEVPKSFLRKDEEAGTEEEILLEHCNLIYDTEQAKVYSYLGLNKALYILTPESENVVDPVQDFRVDQEQEAIWLLESNEDIQIRKIDLRQDHFLEETLIVDGDKMESLIADTYGLFIEEDKAAFWNLHAVLSLSGREEENEEISLGGTASGIYKVTNKEFEIVWEIDRESGEVSAKGYLQDLAVHPLYQEFLFHNLTVDNPFAGNETKLGKKLSFFDDEVYLSDFGKFRKQFAVADFNEDGMDELLFRLKQTEGKEELIYVLAEEKGKLICRDVLRTNSPDGFDDKEETEIFKESMISWFDCASFLEIPTENCKDYKSRDEVFTAVEEGDFSVVVDKNSDPDRLVEIVYESNGDTERMERGDIDGDGFDELVHLIKYDFEDYEQIDFILDYRNGRAVCTYLDWCDGNEWLLLGDAGKLIHCSHSDNGSCNYYGFKECTLNARGIKDIDYAGYGIEVLAVYESVESGLWCWEGQQPEITRRGIYFAEVRSKNAEEIEDTGTAGGWIKKLTSKEQFLEEYKELTGEDFTLRVDLERADIIVTGISGGAFSIGYTDKEWFLEDFDFEDKEPFYQYLDVNGELQLEFYYNEKTDKGCGIRYYPGDKRTPQGFHLNGSAKDLYDSESEYIQEKLLYENCYITHGSMDYYYIYQGEEVVPSYCLVLDHDLGSLYAEVISIHEMIADEAGKQYGIARPDISDNNYYGKVVRKAGDYGADKISNTYEYDYDGDGYYEAFVIIGNYIDMWGEVTEDQISGDLWFVDHDNNAVYLQRHTFNTWQEYIRQDGKTYLFLSHEIGLPWITDIYTVQDNAPVNCGETYRTKYLNETGQVIQIQDAYDSMYDTHEAYDSEALGWLGHTWKPYTFEFDHGELREIGAKEVTLKDVVKIAPLPDSFDEKEYDGVQYILRDNGELNINVAAYHEEFECIRFNYFTYYVDENGEWELTDEGSGHYLIQLDGESHWDYLDEI